MEQLLTLDETKNYLRIGRTKLYQVLAEGEIRSFHVGTRRLVRKFDLDDYVIRRLAEAGFEPDDAGPVSVTSWTSEYTDSGICGDAILATPEKGKMLFDEAVKNLIEWSDEFYSRETMIRRDHHTSQPLSDLPG